MIRADLVTDRWRYVSDFDRGDLERREGAE